MKFKPILFATPMVLAILEGRKTQTRRIVKPQPLFKTARNFIMPDDSPKKWHDCDDVTENCPYGSVGDVVWVRETWRWPEFLGPEDRDYIYKASENGQAWASSDPEWTWKPSIFMPKTACRIFLEITDVRVERLQDISEEDAVAEGVEKNCEGFAGKCISCSKKGGCQADGEWFHYMRDFEDFPAYSARESFFSLWEKINGKESLDANAWTWAVSFKRIDKPEGFI